MSRLTILTFLIIFTTCECLAQDITGTWIGPPGPANPAVLNGVGHAHWVLQLSKDRQVQLSGRMWRQQADTVAVPLNSLSWDGSKLSFSVRLTGIGTVSFEGVLSEDGNWIDGWMLNGPLKLERVPHLRNRKPGPEKPATAAPVSNGRTTTPALATTPGLTTLPASESESSAVLSRALAKLAGTSQRLLKYACLETVERSYYSEPAPKLGAHPMSEAEADSCDGKEFSDDGHLRLDAKDRVRLQVAVADGKEIFSWAAASRFDSRTVFEMIPDGPVSTGAFGPELVDVFENSGVRFAFAGRRIENQREIFRYEFCAVTGEPLLGAGRGWMDHDRLSRLV